LAGTNLIEAGIAGVEEDKGGRRLGEDYEFRCLLPVASPLGVR
jgi:hypothetical protein